MKLIRGKKIAGEVMKDLKCRIEEKEIRPNLAVILIGENKASKLYIRLKSAAAKKAGIGFALFKFRSDAKEKNVISLIKNLNRDKNISGIIVQLPLPEKFNANKIIGKISPEKDADGFHPENIKKFLKSKGSISPVFPTAIMKLIESTKLNLRGRNAIIVANSHIFGKIMAEALKRKKIKSIILSRLNLDKKANLMKMADMIITAVGKPGLIKGAMIKKGVIIIDGGITKKMRKAYGDVDFNSVVTVAGYLSPVPGGVGPMTVACLLENVYKLAVAQNRNK